MEKLNKNSSVFFISFSPYVKKKRGPTNGNIKPFLSFFVPRTKKFTLLDQPHTGSTEVIPIVENYFHGKVRSKYALENIFYKPFYWFLQRSGTSDKETSIFFKIRDFVSVLHVGLKEKHDLLIGLESINALAGLLLKKLGRVKTVIYYVSDYSPTRYKNKVFNWLYIILDRFCCYHADYIWDVSLAMHPARIAAGLDKAKSASVIHVPNALFPKEIKHLPSQEIKPHSLVFMGTLWFHNGPDLAIKALPSVLKKFPQTTLHIIGGGQENLQRLKNLVKKMKLEKKVEFYGLIPDNEKMLSLLRQFYLALAPYVKLKDSVRWFGDSTKLRAYMACGLPVVTTEVPPLGKELSIYGSAIITQDNKESVANAIIKIFSNPSLHKKYRLKAIKYGESNTWENTFLQAFKQMEKEP